MSRYFSGDEIADIKNARGCNVPWDRIAGHYRVPEEEVRNAVGEPKWKREPAQQAAEVNLFASERLDGVL